MKSYESLEQIEQRVFKPSFQRKICDYCISLAKENPVLFKDHIGIKASFLHYLVLDAKPYVDGLVLDIAKTIVAPEFAISSDTEELKDAVRGSFISERQFQERFILLCKDLSIEQLQKIIKDDYERIISYPIQLFILKRIVELYLDDYSLQSALSNLYSWAKYELYIDNSALDEVMAECAAKLTEDEQWELFNQGNLSSPSIEVIRHHLEKVYSDNDYKQSYLKKECFQRAIVNDILSERVNNEIHFSLFGILSNEYIKELREKGNEKIRFFLWVYEIENDQYSDSDIIQLGVDWYSLEEEEWNQIISFFHLLPNEQQVNLFKYLFYLKAIGAETFTVQELYERLTNHGKSQICIALQLTSYILNKKERSLESSISDSELDSIIYSGKGIQAKDKFSLFIKCDGPNVLSYEDANEDNYFTIGRVYDQESKEGSFFKIVFSDQHSYPYAVNDQRFDPDPFIREIVLECDSEHIYRIQKVLEENIPHIKKGDDTYLISFDYEIRVKEFMMKYHLEDHAQLFKNTSSHSLIPLQHHYREEYGKRTCVICDYIGCTRADSNHGIPFVQCGHSSCVCTNHFIVPVFDWDSYTIVDLLYILCGRDKTRQHAVWNEYKILAKSINRVIVRYLLSQQSDPVIIERLNHLLVDYDTPISDLEESEIKVIGNPDNDDEYEWDDMYDDGKKDIENKNDDDTKTYERYSGTWAQEEEGYSDEEIDSIFDGDPSAYWNID